MIRVVHPGPRIRIRDPGPNFLTHPGSGSATLIKISFPSRIYQVLPYKFAELLKVTKAFCAIDTD
jgi:hypothetical protein